MSRTVELPLWLLVAILLFAAIATLDRILAPSVRWFLRRRMERLVERLNTKLKRPIHPFRLLGRNDMIVRLSHDPKVIQAVADHARETGVPESVALAEARGYAREIAPSFSALVYFGFATGAARRLTRAFYRIRVDRVEQALEGVEPQATVVFVMNHRSNMDYVLVTWLVAGQSTLSYAVGEWARVWPLSWLFRSMGAYFIRRKSRNTLYRRVLARYVQISAGEGATQAIFPEGGLSLDGRVGPPKFGLLAYLVAGAGAETRDIIFVPVGIAYDRVLEDRLLTGAGVNGDRRFRVRPLLVTGFLFRTLWRVIRGRFPGFGAAAVAFGTPLSLKEYLAGKDPSAEALADILMARITATIPVLPVPLVAAALARGPVSRAGLAARVAALTERLQARGAILKLPPAGTEDAMAEGLRSLQLRGIVEEDAGLLRPAPQKQALFDFYAAGVLQRAGMDGAARED